VAHIPIERAMDLIVKQGLPVCPQGCADANTATKGSVEKSAAGKQ
jgi:hypothetical protein